MELYAHCVVVLSANSNGIGTKILPEAVGQLQQIWFTKHTQIKVTGASLVVVIIVRSTDIIFCV